MKIPLDALGFHGTSMRDSSRALAGADFPWFGEAGGGGAFRMLGWNSTRKRTEPKWRADFQLAVH